MGSVRGPEAFQYPVEDEQPGRQGRGEALPGGQVPCAGELPARLVLLACGAENWEEIWGFCCVSVNRT